MKILKVTNARTGVELASGVGLADWWWRRAVGLLGRNSLDEAEGLLLRPCSSVHTLGMRFAIDVAFLDREGKVVTASPDLRPGAWARGGRDAHATLELPTGRLAATGTRVGDTLIFEPALA